MSQFKIDGFILSVNDIYTWIDGFIQLFRKDKLQKVKLPQEILDIMLLNNQDKKTADAILSYLSNNDHYMSRFIDIVKDGMADLAIDKGKHSNDQTRR